MRSFTVDGSPVAMDEGDDPWEAHTALGIGFDSFRGSFPRRHADAQRGSIIRAFRTDGSVLYEGEIHKARSRFGMTSIEASGVGDRADDHAQALLYRSDGFSGAVVSSEHGYSSNDKIDVAIRDGRTVFRVPAGESIALDQKASALLWFDSCDISRLDFRATMPGAAMGGWVLDIAVGDGPNGSMNVIHSYDLAADPGPVSLKVPSSADQVMFSLRLNVGPLNPTVARRLVLDELSIWGRFSDDDISGSDVAADVASLMGWDPRGIYGNDGSVLPLYRPDGTNAEVLDYIAALRNWRWAVWEPLVAGAAPVLDFGPWQQVFTGSFERGISEDPSLDELPPYAGVRVNFSSTLGEHRHVVERPDVAPAGVPSDALYNIELSDPQRTDGFAREVGSLSTNYLAAPHAVGTVKIDEVQYEGAYLSGDHVRAGALLEITDSEPAMGPQRVVATTYRPGGAWADIEWDLPLDFIQARSHKLVRRRRHAHHRARRHRGGS